MNADQLRAPEFLIEFDPDPYFIRHPGSPHSIVRLTYSDKEGEFQSVITCVIVEQYTTYVVGSRGNSTAEGFAKFISNLFLLRNAKIAPCVLRNVKDLHLVKYEVLDKADKGLVVELVGGKFVTTLPEIASSKVGIR